MSRYLMSIYSKKTRNPTGFANCSVADCEQNAHHSARGISGYCASHYYRLKKHGSVDGGRTAPGLPLKFLVETAFTYDGNECLKWPYAHNGVGYGNLFIEGKTWRHVQ